MTKKPFQLYTWTEQPPSVRASSWRSDWMDKTDEQFAYRCLPMSIANAHGWEILNQAGFTVSWDGCAENDSVKIQFDDPDIDTSEMSVIPAPEFGHGVVGFHVEALFRTPPGWNLFVTGPINSPKDAISPLTGVVETDWCAATFIVTWAFTRPNTSIRFEAGEPIAHVFPVPRGYLGDFEPELKKLDLSPKLEKQYEAWNESRADFVDDYDEKSGEPQGWQGDYFRGELPDGSQGSRTHETKIRLKDFM